MALFDDFFNPVLDPSVKRDVAYAGAVLARLSYAATTMSNAPWEGMADLTRSAMRVPFVQRVLTPGRVIPNVLALGRADKLIVVIPGTENVQQMVNNVLFSAQRENPAFGPGRIHSFFLWCAEGITQFCADMLASLPELSELVFIGHSLGGAVAQLLADWVKENTSYTVRLVQTFNAPRVGDPQWARRTRSYPSHLYYNTHDLVCELPLSLTPSSTAWQTELGFVDGFEHRDTLVPIPSLRDIRESWWAIGISKVVYPIEWAIGALSRAETARRVMTGLSFIGSRAALASWVLPLPTWIIEHKIDAVVEALEADTRWNRPVEFEDLFNLWHAIGAEGQLVHNPYYNTPAWINPNLFRWNLVPVTYDPVALPAADPADRYETIEAAWIPLPVEAAGPGVELAYVDTAFEEALAARAATSPGNNPLLSAGPVVVAADPRPHNVFRGDDRELLRRLGYYLGRLYRRDVLAVSRPWSAELSTDEQVIPDQAEELKESLEAVLERVRLCLSVHYAD